MRCSDDDDREFSKSCEKLCGEKVHGATWQEGQTISEI